MTHSKKIMRNSFFAFLSKMLIIVFNFVTRKLFITYLDAELLGLNSLFGDLLNLLNIADMGLGIAVQYNLYKPIAEKDNNKINSILNAAKKIYNYIGIAIIIAGVVLSMFIQYLIKDNPYSLSFLRSVFLINVISSASTYFFVHKKLFMCAKEEMHITNIVDMIMSVVASIFKIVTLVIFQNYFVFIIIGVAQAFLSNVMISVICDKKYGRLSEGKEYEKNDMKLLLGNIKELLPNKIGAFVFTNTDNTIISAFLGLTMVTLYTNYFSISNQVFMMAAMVAGVMKVSFGNMLQEGKTDEQHMLFLNSYQLIQFFYSSVCGVAMFCLLGDFIELWYGKEFVLSTSFVVILTLDFFVHSMYQPLSMMLEAKGDFKQLKNQQIVAMILNLAISIGLVIPLGLIGPILGTLVVDILTYIFRIYTVMIKHYRNFLKNHITKILKCFFVFALEYMGFYIIFNKLFSDVTWSSLIVKAIGIVSLTLLINIVAFSRTKEFVYVKSKFMK